MGPGEPDREVGSFESISETELPRLVGFFGRFQGIGISIHIVQ